MLWRIRAIVRVMALGAFTLPGELCVLMKLSRLAEAIYKVALRIWPSQRTMFLPLLGRVYERSGQLEKAQQCYEERKQLVPQEGFAYVELAENYEKQKKTALAIESYEKALQLGTDLAEEFKAELRSRIGRLR